MAAKEISVIPPEFAPGQKVTEALKSGLYLVKGTTIAGSDAAGDYDLFQLPPNTFVESIILDVKTAFDATGSTIIVGDSSDSDGFFDNASALPATLGIKKSTQDTQPYSGGKFYASSDGRLITATLAKGGTSDATTVGTIDTYAVVGFYTDLL